MSIDTLMHKLQAVKDANNGDGTIPVQIIIADHYEGNTYNAESLYVQPSREPTATGGYVEVKTVVFG